MTRRQRQHAETIGAIKAIARQHMSVHGAASLSLGAIARALGLSTPALYRYFPNRDALVTDLILDAYRELGDESDKAVAALESPYARFHAMVYAYRRWALAHAQDYVLIHGAALPGYVVPVELVMGEAVRPLQLIVALLADAEAQGTLRVPAAYASFAIDPAIAAAIGGLSVPLVIQAYTLWLQIHALIWQEIQSPVSTVFGEDGQLFRVEMEVVAARLGLVKPEASGDRTR